MQDDQDSIETVSIDDAAVDSSHPISASSSQQDQCKPLVSPRKRRCTISFRLIVATLSFCLALACALPIWISSEIILRSSTSAQITKQLLESVDGLLGATNDTFAQVERIVKEVCYEAQVTGGQLMVDADMVKNMYLRMLTHQYGTIAGGIKFQYETLNSVGVFQVSTDTDASISNPSLIVLARAYDNATAYTCNFMDKLGTIGADVPCVVVVDQLVANDSVLSQVQLDHLFVSRNPLWTDSYYDPNMQAMAVTYNLPCEMYPGFRGKALVTCYMVLFVFRSYLRELMSRYDNSSMAYIMNLDGQVLGADVPEAMLDKWKGGIFDVQIEPIYAWYLTNETRISQTYQVVLDMVAENPSDAFGASTSVKLDGWGDNLVAYGRVRENTSTINYIVVVVISANERDRTLIRQTENNIIILSVCLIGVAVAIVFIVSRLKKMERLSRILGSYSKYLLMGEEEEKDGIGMGESAVTPHSSVASLWSSSHPPHVKIDVESSGSSASSREMWSKPQKLACGPGSANNKKKMCAYVSQTMRSLRGCVFDSSPKEEAVSAQEQDLVNDAMDSMLTEVGELGSAITTQNRLIDLTKKTTSPAFLRDCMSNKDHCGLYSKRRVLTSMFVDMKNFSSVVEEFGQMEDGKFVVSVINILFQQIVNDIKHFLSYKMNTIGDALFLTFGVPFGSDKMHARHAVLAAIVIHRYSISRANANPYIVKQRKYLKPAGDALRVRIGISTGSGSVGNIGMENSFKQDVIGQVVNESARAEAVRVAKLHPEDPRYQNGYIADDNLVCVMSAATYEQAFAGVSAAQSAYFETIGNNLLDDRIVMIYCPNTRVKHMKPMNVYAVVDLVPYPALPPSENDP